MVLKQRRLLQPLPSRDRREHHNPACCRLLYMSQAGAGWVLLPADQDLAYHYRDD
ncbi:hypothetical protein [Oculatella sp. LEGE 06141]|uniref:hypothetical protein n=1 Tax=Oculatella sp. LEGE 06141 TaxID=1828648 RepID=UPI0030DB8D30